jgi:hexaprenyl-diphosphate synthase
MKGRALHQKNLLKDSIRHAYTSTVCADCLSKAYLLTHPPPTLRRFSTDRGQQSAWGAAVAAVQNTISEALPTRQASGNITIDPLKIVGKELKFLNKNIKQLLGSGHPILDTVAKYYTQSEGKHVRPLLVLLMSRATASAPKRTRRDSFILSNRTIDTPMSSPQVLFDRNPDQSDYTPLTNPSNEIDYAFPNHGAILPSQRRLAEITELIHTASLLHDDVIDHSTTRRSAPSANTLFGNKMAVLAGDFLLGRASVALARLRDPEVTELLATVIANLIEGEFMQLRNTALDEREPKWSEQTVSYYLQKTYLKSASLISKSCRAAALLGHSAPEIVDAAYAYGRNLGLAFQLVDDMLDYTIQESELGKPAGADLELGLATAPLLFAWKDRPELGKLVGRKFAEQGDVDKASLTCTVFEASNRLICSQARHIVLQSDGLEQTRALAQEYADKAMAAISSFPASEAKDGLEEMCVKTMKRRK